MGIIYKEVELWINAFYNNPNKHKDPENEDDSNAMYNIRDKPMINLI